VKKVLTIAAIFVVAAILLVMGIWFYAIPDEYVVEKIEELNLQPLDVEIDDFSKGLFFGFSAKGLVVKNGSDELISLTDIKGQINPFKLFTGKAAIDINGKAYGGEIETGIRLSKGSASADVVLSGVEVGDIPSLRELGLSGKGTLSGNLSYKDNAGKLQCLVDNASFSGFSAEGIFIPMKYFHTIRCAVDIVSQANFEVKSVSLEGKGIFARIKGSIKNRYADLGVEIMPEADFEDSSILMLLDRYKVSEGYYYIPLKTRL